ncbi:MAG: hypothetical protein M0R77_19100 [Gammaproteobacteria bacterium]|nr:hypothetical protein [Gammaproteobacteria bacterium]
MDFVSAGTMTHEQESNIVEYQIVDIDYWEQDAILFIGGQRLYFQWDAKNPPTLIDALNYFKNEIDSKYGITK